MSWEPTGAADLVAEARRVLASTGVLRAAINFGNSVLAQRDPASGRASGVAVELANALGRQLGVKVRLVEFAAAGHVMQALQQNLWDVAFLSADPMRGTELHFTPAYVLIEGAYLVHHDSPLVAPEDVDRDCIRVGAGAGSAYDLFLTRTLRHARIERSATASQAFDRLVRGEHDAAAGVRTVIERYARDHGSLRVLTPSFMEIRQSIAVPRIADLHLAGIRFLTAFIEEMKRDGLIADALRHSGQSDTLAAPLTKE